MPACGACERLCRSMLIIKNTDLKQTKTSAISITIDGTAPRPSKRLWTRSRHNKENGDLSHLTRLHQARPSIQIWFKPQGHMDMKRVLIAWFGILSLTLPSLSLADNLNGKTLFSQRCAMCHGADIKGTGPLANKSNPPTPDLTTAAFKKRLRDYPGVIVSSIILRPNGDLIPRTLRENGVKLPPFAWRVNDFRDLNQYMSGVIAQSR